MAECLIADSNRVSPPGSWVIRHSRAVGEVLARSATQRSGVTAPDPSGWRRRWRGRTGMGAAQRHAVWDFGGGGSVAVPGSGDDRAREAW